MRIADKTCNMKRILPISLVILVSILISGSSFAEMYKWVDEKGAVHFTDDITQVPERYRPKTEHIGAPEEKEESSAEGEVIVPNKGRTSKEEVYKDELGRGEDYWKGRTDEWKRKLKEQQDRLDTLRLKYNGLTEKYNDSRSTAERGTLRKERDQVKAEMDQVKIQIEEAKATLEKRIPEEAQSYKAKPEWVK